MFSSFCQEQYVCGGEGGRRSSFSPAVVAGSEVSGRARRHGCAGLPKPDLPTPFKPPQTIEWPVAKSEFVDQGDDSPHPAIGDIDRLPGRIGPPQNEEDIFRQALFDNPGISLL